MTADTHLQEVRDRLVSELSQETINFERVLELSSRLTEFDPDFVRFSVDASHISRLGRELVARRETAISELIKNAYDADARNVVLTFENGEKPGGALEISDDGTGMTRDELVRGFMRISSPSKVHAPRSPQYRRRRAGRKGIGRFAAQRLGTALSITTQVEGEDHALRVSIDWSKFTRDRALESIGSTISVIPKMRPHGTVLRVDHLRDVWTDAAIRRVYRYVSELIQPFPIARLADNEADGGDPGFKVRIDRVLDGLTQTIADEQKLVFEHALGEIDAWVDESGYGYWSVTSGRFGIRQEGQPIGPDPDDSETPFAALRGVRVKAYYYIADSEYLPRIFISTIRKLLRERGGIRLYRNGFRVPPYGDLGDDWLGLDLSERRRVLLVPHGNDNFLGVVDVDDPRGMVFEETSSREGLLENEAFRELREFAERAIKAAVIRVNEARGVKIYANQPDWTAQRPQKPSAKVRSAADELSVVAQELTTVEDVAVGSGFQPGGAAVSQRLARIAAGLAYAAAEAEEEEEALLAEVGMLRVLASLGLAIGEFTHEVRQYLPAIAADASILASVFPPEHSARLSAERLATNVAAFKSYADYFDAALADNASRQLQVVEIRDVVNKFLTTIDPARRRAGISVEPSHFEGYQLFVRPMHASEWASLLFNLYTNAQKAIRRANVPGRILVRAGRVDDRIFLEFCDDGIGIPAEFRNRIFNPFFTTGTPAGFRAGAHEEVTGTGLGLKIVKDIVDGYEGRVFVADPPEDFNTCIRIEIPAASPEQIPGDIL